MYDSTSLGKTHAVGKIVAVRSTLRFGVWYVDDGLIAALEFAMDDLVSELLSFIATGGGI